MLDGEVMLCLSVPQRRPRKANNGFVGKGGNDERLDESGSSAIDEPASSLV